MAVSYETIVECDNLVRIYETDEVEVVALQGLDLTIKKGELTAIVGKSGSGKSTLLNIIAGLDRPSAGAITIAGNDLLKFNNKQLEAYNRETIGFIWQNNSRNLIPYLSARINVEVPMMITGKRDRKDRAKELLDLVGLVNRYDSKLKELSGGEQQRVAIAISLANNPQIILADEPTGSVDSKTTYHLMEVFNKLNSDLGSTIIIVTHDTKVATMVKRVVTMSDGMISSEMIKRDDYLQKLTQIGGVTHPSESHETFGVVDNKGRLRIPEEFLSEMNLKGGDRVKLQKNENGFEVYQNENVMGRKV